MSGEKTNALPVQEIITKKVEYLSPNQKAYRRFKKNKPAIFGFFIIILSIFIALFGYLLAPDHTPDANDQILQIATKEAGFSVKTLGTRKNQELPANGFLNRLWAGSPNPNTLIPIQNYRFEGANIIVEEYTGNPDDKIEKSVPLASVAYSLSVDDPSVAVSGNQVSFKDINNKTINTTLEDLQKKVEQSHIQEKTYWMGTDKFGRDNLSRLILGVRVSLSVGLMAVLISLFIGITMGSLAGYYRGRVDDFIMWIINVFWSIPFLLLVFALVIALGREFWQIYLAVGLTMWVEVARIVRGQFLSIREKEFVEAAQSLGFSDFRTIVVHILPNIIGPIIVITAANFATAIIIEAGLSFLGIGVQPPKPSWGTMLKEYYGYIGTNKAFLALLPGTAILILVLAFNLVGNGLRDALDVKTKSN